jgi:hypothetical protein
MVMCDKYMPMLQVEEYNWAAIYCYGCANVNMLDSLSRALKVWNLLVLQLWTLLWFVMIKLLSDNIKGSLTKTKP